MKTISSILTLAALSSLASAEVISDERREPPTAPPHQKIPHGKPKPEPGKLAFPIPGPLNPAFTTNLYNQLRQEDGNVFFSPYGISECMGMVYAGAGNNTATEIGKALSFQNDSNTTASQLQMMRAHLGRSLNQGDNRLRVANALCVTGAVPKEGFQDIVRKQFEGELFAGGLDKINGWVKQQTEGNIEKILDQLDPNSACVLLNAVYFKGSWEQSFNARATHKAPFHLGNGEKVKVDMMMREGMFRVVRDMSMTAVELNYQTGASMVLIQPAKADGMKAFEENLIPVIVNDLPTRLAKAEPQEAKLFLPKFKIATEFNLIPAMKGLGMSDAFMAKKSDFSVMYDRSDAHIGQIKHKATLEVDEQGSVATAATAVEMKLESASIEPPKPKIRFDRPFLVVIRDRASGTNLFMGRINDPTQ